MSKYIIFLRSNEEMVLISITPTEGGNQGNVSNDESQAMLFDSEGQANETILTLNGGSEFWGSRPDKRRPKPHQ